MTEAPELWPIWAKRFPMGCRKINLQVRTSNAALVEFYKKLDYIVYSRRAHKHGQATVMCLVLELSCPNPSDSASLWAIGSFRTISPAIASPRFWLAQPLAASSVIVTAPSQIAHAIPDPAH
jgi:hypothetical protein